MSSWVLKHYFNYYPVFHMSEVCLFANDSTFFLPLTQCLLQPKIIQRWHQPMNLSFLYTFLKVVLVWKMFSPSVGWSPPLRTFHRPCITDTNLWILPWITEETLDVWIYLYRVLLITHVWSSLDNSMHLNRNFHALSLFMARKVYATYFYIEIS